MNGLKYAWDVAKAVLKARAQELGLLYDRRFDMRLGRARTRSTSSKLDYDSPHSYALDAHPAGARVLDLGCAGGYMGALLKQQKRLQRRRRRRVPAARRRRARRASASTI